MKRKFGLSFYGKFYQSLIICLSLVSASISPVFAQTDDNQVNAPVLTANAARFKKKIEKIGRFGDLTVVAKNGNELYGSIDSIGEESFMINDVDKGQKIEVKYEEIKDIWKNYGKHRARNGKRIRPRKHLIATGIIVAVLAIPIILVATSLDE
ncbi:MAG: hypothetical protein R2681_08000 [Pyrinomonadaceae bacterium]